MGGCNMIKKILKVSGVILSLIVIGIALLLGYPYPFYKHNHNLKIFTQNFDAIKLPKGTSQFGETFRNYGNMAGASNSGGYLVAKLIKSKGNIETLREYYGPIKLPPGELYERNGLDRRDSTEIYVIKFSAFEKLSFVHPLRMNRSKVEKKFNVSQMIKQEDMFLIFSCDNGYFPASWDLRDH